ncbi:MAG: cytochrome c biogenesis heme-transporting ATPase CcmA [Proteobacteria bacterium]|nr:MAG: cytochrome c biogenesis heme-transporting ATPase CcmA [Pseudomonadota bacterium]
MKYPRENLLESVELCCVRGDNMLFEDLNFAIDAGDICQVHGANGAGKTSLLRLLCGLSIPESGEVRWNGAAIDDQPDAFRSALAYIGHHNGIKGELNPKENLESTRALMPCRDDIEPVAALERVGLYGYEDIPCRYLSAGQKRRVAIARLLLSSAPLWILDEPVTALDVDGVRDFQLLLEAHANAGGMVVITSHQPLRFGSVDTRMIQL